MIKDLVIKKKIYEPRKQNCWLIVSLLSVAWNTTRLTSLLSASCSGIKKGSRIVFTRHVRRGEASFKLLAHSEEKLSNVKKSISQRGPTKNVLDPDRFHFATC